MADNIIMTDVNQMPVGHAKRFGDEWAVVVEGPPMMKTVHSEQEALDALNMWLVDVKHIPGLTVEII